MTDENPTLGPQPESTTAKTRHTLRDGFGALTDLSFTKPATPAVAKILYLAVVVLGVAAWIFGALKMIVFGFIGAMHGGGMMGGRGGHGPMMGGGGGVFAVACGFLWLLFGWIAVLFWVMVARLVLEFFVDHSRSAQR